MRMASSLHRISTATTGKRQTRPEHAGPAVSGQGGAPFDQFDPRGKRTVLWNAVCGKGTAFFRNIFRTGGKGHLGIYSNESLPFVFSVHRQAYFRYGGSRKGGTLVSCSFRASCECGVKADCLCGTGCGYAVRCHVQQACRGVLPENDSIFRHVSVSACFCAGIAASGQRGSGGTIT